MKRKVLLAEFRHETNSFAPTKTDMAAYRDKYIKTGAEIIPFFREVRDSLGGMIDACEAEGLEMVPAIAANATPGGKVTKEVFEFVQKSIIDSLKETKVDGILLSLHGAMVPDFTFDGEGELLANVREVVGAQIPIIGTLDLHANITEKMVRSADVLIGNDEYPHIDSYERGHEAGKNMAAILRNELRPVMRLRQIPILCPMLASGREPIANYVRMIHQWEQQANAVCATLFHGFFFSNIPDVWMSIVAVTDNEPGLAEALLREVGDKILANRRMFTKEILSIEAAIKRAVSATEGPIVLADISDNPGGGAAGDSTHILRKLIEMKVQDVGLAIIVDRRTVEQAIEAGVGARVSIQLGGKSGPVSGGPIETTAIVKSITDGTFRNKGPMGRGLRVEVGRTVVLGIDGSEVVVCERNFQPYDPEIFRRNGIDPIDKKILVVKSALHFRAAYGPIVKDMIEVDAPGVASQHPENFDLNYVRRPVFPLDQ
jgi:microcystin degradation protein MlrC